MAKNGHNAIMNYIDDLIYCGLPSTVNQSYQFLLNLLQDLGLNISHKKLCPPDTEVIYLGILLFIYLFIYYVAFNTVQVISRRVVGRAEETST